MQNVLHINGPKLFEDLQNSCEDLLFILEYVIVIKECKKIAWQ